MIKKEKIGQLTKFGRINYPKMRLLFLYLSSILLKKLRENSSMNKRNDLGRPRTASKEAIMDSIEELVCSQEEWFHTHLAPRKISYSSI